MGHAPDVGDGVGCWVLVVGLSVVASGMALGKGIHELDNTVWETRVLLTLGMIAHDIFGSRLMVRFKNS